MNQIGLKPTERKYIGTSTEPFEPPTFTRRISFGNLRARQHPRQSGGHVSTDVVKPIDFAGPRRICREITEAPKLYAGTLLGCVGHFDIAAVVKSTISCCAAGYVIVSWVAISLPVEWEIIRGKMVVIGNRSEC